MAKRKGSSAPSCSRAREKAAKGGSETEVERDARDFENAQRLLEKLPPEVWGKILDNLDENDLFPLALSCRYFRQKQKELVARKTRENGPGSEKSRLALKTTVWQKVGFAEPASADYVRFCSQEREKDFGHKRDKVIRELAAYRGYLPLLQELLKSLNTLDREITRGAGESPSLPSLLLIRRLLCFGF